MEWHPTITIPHGMMYIPWGKKGYSRFVDFWWVCYLNVLLAWLIVIKNAYKKWVTNKTQKTSAIKLVVWKRVKFGIYTTFLARELTFQILFRVVLIIKCQSFHHSLVCLRKSRTTNTRTVEGEVGAGYNSTMHLYRWDMDKIWIFLLESNKTRLHWP